MALPAFVRDLFVRPETVKVLVTTSPEGRPHAIVCASIFAVDENTLAVGEILMSTSKKNMAANKNVALEVIAGKEAYEAYCEVKERQDSGPILQALNDKLDKVGMKAKAVWLFTVKEVTNESAGPYAGKVIA